MSHVSTKPKPIPATGPLTAAMIGFLMFMPSKKDLDSGRVAAAAAFVVVVGALDVSNGWHQQRWQ
jgi:hypothetical protein